jgi:hypothetical protein
MTAETSSKAKSNILTAVLSNGQFFCNVKPCLTTDFQEEYQAVFVRIKQSKTHRLHYKKFGNDTPSDTAPLSLKN